MTTAGWAKFGVSWNFASAGTPGHEAAHSAGLNHVNCLGDTDGDGISQEDEGGAIDWDHPTMLPPVCSLAPIDPDGYFGFTNYHSPVVIYSNDPAHPLAAFPFMGYKTPKWTDPYDWCLLLDTFGVPCDPASIGVPPTPHIVDVDCDPEPIGPSGFQLDLCVGTDLPGGESPYQSGVEVSVADVEGSQTLTLAGGETDFRIPLEPTRVGDGGWPARRHRRDTGRAVTRTDGGGRVCAVRSTGVRAARARRGDHARWSKARRPSSRALQLVAADGTALAVVPIVIERTATHGEAATDGSSDEFRSPVPWVDGAVAVELIVDGTVVDSLPIASEPPPAPTVEVQQHGDDGVVDPVELAAAGSVGEAPTFDVLWGDEGGHWVPVGTGL